LKQQKIIILSQTSLILWINAYLAVWKIFIWGECAYVAHKIIWIIIGFDFLQSKVLHCRWPLSYFWFKWITIHSEQQTWSWFFKNDVTNKAQFTYTKSFK